MGTDRHVGIFWLVIVLSIIALLAGCGGSSSGGPGVIGGESTNSDSSPSKTLNAYSSAIAAGDATNALEYVSKYSKDRQKPVLETAVVDPYYREHLAEAIKNATEESRTDHVIYYKMTMITKDGQTVEDKFRLIFEDGSWKLTGL